jgi:hypothetical protein
MKRRTMIQLSAGGFLGLSRWLSGGAAPAGGKAGYGPLVKDPEGVLDLPAGFRYRILARAGETMSDGLVRPGKPDGMGAFAMPDGPVRLVCNHELALAWKEWGPFPPAKTKGLSAEIQAACYDFDKKGEAYPGGTTTLEYHPDTGDVKRQWLSLAGTDRNCAGGVTPWGSWITCEEPDEIEGEAGRKHGYCFEVKAAVDGLQKAVPLKGLGRFRHEAVAVDPGTGAIYLTEDRDYALLYRFLPAVMTDSGPDWAKGGKLQFLANENGDLQHTHNWNEAKGARFPLGQEVAAVWKDIDDPDPERDFLRERGAKQGGMLFSRTEGIVAGRDESGAFEAYVCTTSGGRKKYGQIFRLHPGADTTTIELYLQPDDSDVLTNGDNLALAPWGDLIICEDTKGVNHLRGVTPQGGFYTLAGGGEGREFAGACFAPGHDTLFVNMQSEGLTLAIEGPWRKS